MENLVSSICNLNTRKFGDVSMSKVLDEVTQEYEGLIRQATSVAEKQKLKKVI